MNDYKNLTSLALAFVGDAYHTLYIRNKVLADKVNSQKNYHVKASKYCNAKSQRQALEMVSDMLTDEELEVVRRARNAKSKHQAKNYSEEDYKKATAFEALIGYLYLQSNLERIDELFDKIYS